MQKKTTRSYPGRGKVVSAVPKGGGEGKVWSSTRKMTEQIRYHVENQFA